MHLPISLCAAAFAACAFLSPTLRAQVQALNPGDERTACTLIFADMSNGGFSPKGAVNINYTQPEWKDSYTKALDSGKFNNTNQRLGKNWWTSFDTMVTLDIGGTTVAPGTYYLGIHVDEGGKFHLMFLDPKQALTSGWAPFMPEPWKTNTMAALTLAKDSLKQPQNKMVIEISADQANPTKGKFSIQWGPHELSAPVKFGLPNTKDASAGKDK